MNSDILKGKWKQVRGVLKVQWGKLTDDDLDIIDGNFDKLAGKVQELYGEAHSAIKDKVASFIAKIHEELDKK